MASGSWLDSVFEDARRDFLNGLKDYAIQDQQSKTWTLVALKRIQPFITILQEYFTVIDTFAQIEPKMTCLVWGPLKLIIQLASSLTTAFRKLVDLLEEIGRMLPNFKRYAESGLFDQNDQVKTVMGLFYRDILDLNLAILNFFRNKSLHMILEPLWPKFRNEVEVVQASIEKHKSLMTSNVTLEHILEAKEFRRRTLSKYEEDVKFQNDSRFKDLSSIMASPSCKSRLQSAIEASSPSSGEWLFNNPTFQKWLSPGSSFQRLLWIQGIPGAGKTFLSATAIHQLQSQGHLVLYAFLSHDFQSLGNGARLLHSLTFQAVEANRDLVAVVHSASISTGQEFTSNTNSAKDLLCDLLTNSAPTFIVLDGLDEIEHQKRGNLLKTLLEILESCENLKLLVSSRAERDIMRLLEGISCSVTVDDNNSKDIEQHVEQEGESWTAELRELGADDPDLAVIKAGLKEVVARAKGMFLYVKLVLQVARSQPDLESIRTEMQNLPDGLNQAYGRILSRIKDKKLARRALLWIACAKIPLAKSEILQAILIRPLMPDFPKHRMAWVDLQTLCGPIIEIRDGMVQFVHFTSREYLFEEQSGRFLVKQDGHIEILSTCLTYCSFRSFDHVYDDISVEELRGRVRPGDFILFGYAADFWLDHAKSLRQHQQEQDDMSERICKTVAHLYRKRKQATLEEFQTVESEGFLGDFPFFERTPELQQLLSVSARLLDGLRYGHISPEDQISEDPTSLSLATSRFQKTLEEMFSQCPSSQHSRNPTHPADCFCRKAPQLYGTRIFKCKWSFCEFHLRGFSNSVSRNEHEKTHQRPFKCPEAGCLYASLGYENESDLMQHKFGIHDNGSLGQLRNRTDIQHLLRKDLIAIMELAILNNDVQSTRNLLSIALAQGEYFRFDLPLQLAAWKGSTGMIDLLVSDGVIAATTIGRSFSSILQNALVVAIDVNNIITVRALLDHGADVNKTGRPHHMLQRRFLTPRKIALCGEMEYTPVSSAFFHMNDRMLALLVDDFGAKVAPVDFTSAIKGTKKNQMEFFENLPKFKRWISVPESYSYGILTATTYGHHVALEACLENGGDPNARLPIWDFSYPAAFLAVRKFDKSPQRTNLLLSVLKAGADPYPKKPNGKTVRRVKNMPEVEAYFGLTWKELVQKTQAGEMVLPVNTDGKKDKTSAKVDGI
ncbi:hypothetical protein K458DRAFT_436809 [Lentithecium fluviatile CBS 122367]|uniref:NACHT domain-containing protein n=1 Tax=Lentithecium fluviatile CBS 122367 TaxID=1168545 RepID=A0A6G1IG17_9PLEO|nr:hypothetical protein K458DRAFT_436809 [Lentithecium fluviatile CBS 122367]